MGAELLSVGIDIGTSTTQVIFSRLAMENTASYFSIPHVAITHKEVVYKSKIYTTPLIDLRTIDAQKVREVVQAEFQSAGFSPADTKTGAVIITGESARKENSASVLEQLSRFAGDFVVSTAGPDLEAIIAGKGSGAQQDSKEMGSVTANIDVGGGTSNLVVFDDGEVIAKGCLDIGGRIIRVDPDSMRLLYVSESAAAIARSVGVQLAAGETASIAALERVSKKMAQLLAQSLGFAPQEPLLEVIRTPGSSPFVLERPIQALCFSGGVADAMQAPEAPQFPYGDIGILLGRALANENFPVRRVQAAETIRATVVGAGSYTTSISGSTITYASELFPLKNIPVLKLNQQEQAECFAGNSALLEERVRWFLEQCGQDTMVLGMKGEANPSYPALKRLAGCIAQAMDAALAAGAPLLVVVQQDIAKALGVSIGQLLKGRRKIAVLDGIQLNQQDYMDFGRPAMNGLVIPVVVKTLIFG